MKTATSTALLARGLLQGAQDIEPVALLELQVEDQQVPIARRQQGLGGDLGVGEAGDGDVGHVRQRLFEP